MNNDYIGGKRSKKSRNIGYLSMTLLVVIWGFEYVVAKNALKVFEPMSLLFLRYGIGVIVVVIIKLFTDRKGHIRLKDIPLFILCAIFGEILYFYCEYTAMDYIPISLITIILSFVPAVSIFIERVIFKRVITMKVVIGILVSIIGVTLVIGVDWAILFQGRIFGYLLTFGAVFCWNIYNYVTAALHERYTSITLTMTQMICTLLLIGPYALARMPDEGVLTPSVVGGIIYIGVLAAGVGFVISVKSLQLLGPTTSALFSNFLPITTAVFGWMFLKEHLSVMQIIGGTIVIWSGCVVIREKGKMEETLND